jgi:hypothetical protein
MHNRLELPQFRRITKNAAGKLSTIDMASDICTWERLIDLCDSFSFVERVYNRIRIEHRHAHIRKEAGGRRFAHSN